ncbi:MAG: DNA repair protein RecN, partial [Syntrophales bacterium]
AVSLLLGERSSADMIRSFEESATVEALFDIGEKEDLKKRIRQMGFHVGKELILKRIISRTGKNRVYIDGQLATLGMLSDITESLINICGQHEHQVILNADNHIDILDEFGDLLPVRLEYSDMYGKYISLKEKIKESLSVKKTRGEREDHLRFQSKEIGDAGVRAGEDAALLEEKKILNNMQRLMDHAASAHDVLYGRAGSVLGELRAAVANIREIKKIDVGLRLSDGDLDNIYYQLEETAFVLRDYMKKLSYDPARLEVIDDRLELLSRLKRKYGRTLEEVLQKKLQIEEELTAIASVEDEIEKMSKDLEALSPRLLEKASELSKRRRHTASILKKAIEGEIHSLRMDNAAFEVSLKTPDDHQGSDSFNDKGIDEVEFFLSTNVGEPLKPLNRIASGGELSRIILALKNVLAKTGSVGTIIFDEVDSGIGGATAEDVGKKLKGVAKHHQILCITHLPQIACYGDRHYHVVKTVSGERTIASVDVLSDKERLDEIARMLGGTELTKKTKEHAREMLELSRR